MKKTKNVRILFCACSLLALAGVIGVGAKDSLGSFTKVMNPLAAASDNTYYSGFDSVDDVKKAGEELNKEICAESFVLMKNKDNTLPLEGVKNVSVFGKGSVAPATTGGGSGSGNSSSESILIYDSLENAGFNVNKSLQSFYADDTRSGKPGSTTGMNFGGPSVRESTIGETALADYDKTVRASFNNFNDAAIIVLRRSGSEGADTPRNNVRDHVEDTADVNQSYLELSKNEKDMINLVKTSGFKKIVVLVNTPSTLEMSELQNDDAIGGILWVGVPGSNGFDALGKILNGSVNPSGRLVDTWATNLEDGPTYYNFGNGSQGSADGKTSLYSFDNGNSKLSNNKFVRYEEGIYVGYKYYETKAADMDKASAGTGETWFDQSVTYPFGYGLSYTSFTQTIESATPASGAFTEDNLDFVVKVRVKNTGTVAGKEVVQAYWKAPYIDGQIEKSDRLMAGFAKTSLLAPGAEEVVEIKFNAQDLASYDYNDANNNEHKGYELDAGAYKVTINDDSHEEIASINYTLAEGIKFTTNRHTGATVENQFSNRENNSLPNTDSGFGMELMTRASANAFVQPNAPTTDDMSIPADGEITKRISYVMDLTELESDNTYYKSIYNVTDPRRKTATDCADFEQVAESSTRTETEISFADISGITLDDERWDTILDDLKWSEMTTLVSDGGWHNPGLAAMGKPQGIDIDGPSGTGLVSYASEIMIASTWNVELTDKFGELVGEECLWLKHNGWYAPAINCHRSPFAGRNFEYYSEDPTMSGIMGTHTVQKVQEKGVYAYTKHFAMNDQETDRGGLATFASEQTVREVYLKAYEPVFTVAHSMGMMGGMNKIGLVDNYADMNLMINVLRKEWGFKGLAETDAYFGGSYKTTTYGNPAALAVSGINMTLGSVSDRTFYGEYDATTNKVMIQDKTGTSTAVPGYSVWSAVRESTKQILYTIANSNQQNNNLKLSLFASKEFTAPVNIAYTGSIAIDRTELGTKNVTYSLDSGSLPTGLSLASDGTISGTPTESGTFEFDTTIHADGWVTKTVTNKIVITDLMKISAATDNIAIGSAVNIQISTEHLNAADYDEGGLTYRVGLGSTLPAGLNIDSNGLITGTPTELGETTTNIQIVTKKTTQGWRGPSVTTKVYSQNVTFNVTGSIKKTIIINNGTGTTTVDVVEGQTLAIPETPTREGYEFTGWYRDEACTATYNFNDAVTENTTIYAGWKAVVAEVKENDPVAVSSLVVGIVAVVGVLGLAVLSLLGKKKAK